MRSGRHATTPRRSSPGTRSWRTAMAEKTRTKTPREAGLDRRRKFFGPPGAEKALEAASEFRRPLEEIVTDYCFGVVWERPGLDDKTRSMLTIAILTAL